jgi:hypothetical protein
LSYSIENVLNALAQNEVGCPSNCLGIDRATDLFVGYLTLDALCGGVDRHPNNWEVMLVNRRLDLVPSFDHGSSLGGNLSEATRGMITASDFAPNLMKSAFWNNTERIDPVQAFEIAVKLYPQIVWQQRLKAITSTQINDIFDRIPEGRITPSAAKFAIDLLEFNRQELLLVYDKYIAESTRKYEQLVQSNLASLKAEIDKYSENPDLTFTENTLSFMKEFIKDRLERAGYPNPQNVVADPPASEFDTELKQRLFNRVEDNILELEDSDNLLKLEAEIRQEMVKEGLIEQQNDESSVGLITISEDEKEEEGEDIGWHI